MKTAGFNKSLVHIPDCKASHCQTAAATNSSLTGEGQIPEIISTLHMPRLKKKQYPVHWYDKLATVINLLTILTLPHPT